MGCSNKNDHAGQSNIDSLVNEAALPSSLSTIDSSEIIQHYLDIPFKDFHSITREARLEGIGDASVNKEEGSVTLILNLDLGYIMNGFTLIPINKNYMLSIHWSRGEDCTPSDLIEMFKHDGTKWIQWPQGLPQTKETDFYNHKESINWTLFSYKALSNAMQLKVSLVPPQSAWDFTNCDYGANIPQPEVPYNYCDERGDIISYVFDQVSNRMKFAQYSEVVYSWDSVLSKFILLKKVENTNTTSKELPYRFYNDSKSLAKLLDSLGIGKSGDILDSPDFILKPCEMVSGALRQNPCKEMQTYLSIAEIADKPSSTISDRDPKLFPAMIIYTPFSQTVQTLMAAFAFKNEKKVYLYFQESDSPFSFKAVWANYDNKLKSWVFKYYNKDYISDRYFEIKDEDISYLVFNKVAKGLEKLTTPCEEN